MSKHTPTPKPWTYNPVTGRVEASISASGRHGQVTVCDVYSAGEGMEYDTSDGAADANGILISAAPDLLAACEYALNIIDDGPTAEPWARNVCATLRAAIAKARGEQ